MRGLHRMYSLGIGMQNDPQLPRGRGHQTEKSTREPTMAMTKRDFLIGAAAASGGVIFSRFDASGQAERRVIDAHTHWYPAQWVDLVQNEGEAAGARIGRNDRGGITFTSARCSTRTTSIWKAASNPWTRPASMRRCSRS